MLPARQNKIDLSKLSDAEKKVFQLYGKLPTNKSCLLKIPPERKYFDSGDYALSKAGKTAEPVGVEHPSPEDIPHFTSQYGIQSVSSSAKENYTFYNSVEESSEEEEDASCQEGGTHEW